MNNQKSFFLLVLSLLLSGFTTAQEVDSQAMYTYRDGDPNGIGKWFMGREIAHVMGFQGMGWLERSEREEEENTTTLIGNMNIQPTDVIADIGAGSGYHVFKMAPLTPNGTVYAVDIQEQMLAAIQSKKDNNSIQNINLVLGSEQSVNLPKNSLDKVLMVDVYHEFSFPYQMIQSIKSALKPGGKLYLIEYRAEDAWVPIKQIHKMTQHQAVLELQASGFRLEQNIDNLPWQHCMVFVKDN